MSTNVNNVVSTMKSVDKSISNDEILTNGLLSSSTTARAPPHVYSCFVINCTAEPIECSLKYNGRPGEEKFDEIVNVTISGNTEHYFPRKFFQPELPDSYCKWVKIITNIRVKKANKQILEVNYPFEHVRYPIRNWEFHITDKEEILSKPPTRVVNVLKYENLDQYEC
ncbi:unnamed protein product [Adineta ricciae]|uniref:Uncharacterized protein n=1 Tax=Adineta ricciae TaxID=249248 RepID=A0A815W040_ADIRI|nr:unnamed protein product [Adineta ricciae]CAF1588056.1 unnamed protein product [Adineta ricciae]